MRPGPAFVDLAAATDVREVGGKAAGLAHAMSLGCRVPEAVVLGASIDPPDTATLGRLLERLGGSVAVRSSGVEEDGATASFAGQFESVLGIDSIPGLEEAIRRCLDSARSASAREYGERFHRADSSMAVILQRMLEPEAAGAAFSIDPVTGDDHVVIEAVPGLGDHLLEGTATGDRWVVGETATAETSGETLDPGTALEISALCRRLADATGGPVDIEWAIEDGVLYLLQVRPITVIPIEPAERPPQGQTYVREARFDRPLHPLSFTAWLPRHGRILGEQFAHFGMPVAGLESRRFLGRVYGRVVPLIDRGKDGPAPPAPILRLLMTLVPTMRRRLGAALAWDGDDAIVELIEAWESRGRKATTERTLELRSRPLTSLSDAALADHLGDVIAHVDDTARRHFELAFATQIIPTGRLGMFLEEMLRWSPDRIVGLLGGHGESSTEHGRALAALAGALGPDGVERAIADPPWLLDRPEAADYLERHGHRVNVDLTQRTEAEDPGRIADHLRRHRERSATALDPRRVAAELEDEARAALDDRSIAEFDRLLSLARRGRPYNDETEVTTLDALTLIRPIALETGRRFAETDRLPDEDDVFFLELDELEAMLRSPSRPAPELRRRRGEHRWALANPAPDHLGPDPVAAPSWRTVPARYRSTVGAALWSLAASESPAPPAEVPGGALVGTPASPGTATGPVRIIRSMSEFDRVEPGDIVVCPTTVAAWSPIFGSIGALVTERGGPLSHPATLAREYGLPAVLAVPNATTRLEDGRRVKVDGGAGTVELI